MRPVVIMFICIGFSCVVARTITFGISVSTQAPIGFQNLSGRSSSILAGLEFFAQVASTWNIPTSFYRNDSFTFAVKYLEDYGNSTIVRQNYEVMINDPEINFLLGPVSSELSLVAKSVTEPARRLLLGTDVGSASFYTGAEFSFAVTSSPPRYATTILPEFRIREMRRIVLVVEQTPDQIDIAEGFLANIGDFNVDIMDVYKVPSGDIIDDELVQNITDTVELIRSLDFWNGTETHSFDAVVITSFTNVGRYFMEAIRNINYTPKAIYRSSFNLPEFQALDPSLTAFVSGCDVIAPGTNFRGNYFGTYEDFRSAFQGSHPDLAPADANHGIGAVSGLLILRSIMTAGKNITLDNGEVARALGRINEETFFGPFQFGADHGQLRFTPMMQFVPEEYSYFKYATSDTLNFNNTVRAIGPSRIATGDSVYPIPTWEERKFNPQYVVAEYAIMIITAVGQVLSITCIILTVIFRHHRVIKASSPLFLIYILVGTLLSYSANYTWTVTQFNNASCILTPLVLGLGFVITFGALFAKSWRIVTLFRSAEKLTVVAISNKKLTVILSILVGIQAVLSIVLAWYSNLEVIVTDVHRPALWLQQCTDLRYNIVLAINIAYAGLIILTGLVLAVMMRKIKNQLFNEAQHLAFIIYTTAVFVAIVIALSFNIFTGVNQYILRGLAILVINLTTVIALFGTKFNFIRTGKLPINEDPTAQHRYIPSPRDREEANQYTANQKISEEIAELKRLRDSLKKENEILRNSDTSHANVSGLSQVMLLSDKGDDSYEDYSGTSSSSSD